MKLLFDFFPILIFFISYKFFGIYTATSVAMIASLMQVILYRFKHQRYENMHLINLGVIFILGGATLFFHNVWFIKWKPTGIYWLTSLLFLASPLFFKKPLIEKMLASNISLPPKIWFRLNYAWALFFALMGGLNLYVAYTYSTDIWVNFKLFGCTACTLVFIVLQAVYLTRHFVDKELEHQSSDAR